MNTVQYDTILQSGKHGQFEEQINYDAYKINKRKGVHHLGRAGMLLVLNMNNKCSINSKKGVNYVYGKYCYNTNVLILSMYWLDS